MKLQLVIVETNETVSYFEFPLFDIYVAVSRTHCRAYLISSYVGGLGD